MTWKRLGQDNSRYIRFEVGKSIEGVYEGFIERPSPFETGKILTDYTIIQDGKEKILSTMSENLKALRTLEKGTKIKIDMLQKGIKKLYNISIQE